RGQQAAGAYFRYFETYFIIAIIYFVLTFATTRILRVIERKMDGPDSYAIYGSQSSATAEIHIKKR
ncbi:MAG: amino acid ABC transporter permease, partial [Clostridia bacterium]